MQALNLIGLTLIAALAAAPLQAEEYVIDTQGAHASVTFRIQHLGYSWLYGRFNDFSGSFSYDEKVPEASRVSVSIDTASVDSNHAERDKHLRSGDFLAVDEFPKATFESTAYKPAADGTAKLEGKLTLHGVTRPITIDVAQVGAGKDPWGGFRRGFTGSTTLALKDYAIDFNLGPASTHVELTLNVEGIRQ